MLFANGWHAFRLSSGPHFLASACTAVLTVCVSVIFGHFFAGLSDCAGGGTNFGLGFFPPVFAAPPPAAAPFAAPPPAAGAPSGAASPPQIPPMVQSHKLLPPLVTGAFADLGLNRLKPK